MRPTTTRRRALRLLPLTAAAATTAILGSAGGASGAGSGIGVPDPPKAKDIICLDRCLALRTGTVGGKVQVSGRNLEFVTGVRFQRKGGGNVTAKPVRTRRKSVVVEVPRRARSGRPFVLDDHGGRSRVPNRLTVRSASAIDNPGPFEMKSISSSPRKIYYYGKQRGKVTFLFKAENEVDMQIQVVRRGENAKVVRSFFKPGMKPFKTHTVKWDGSQEDGSPVGDGRYRFVVSPAAGASSAASGDAEDTKIRVYRHIFPLRAKHRYGDGLGAGRSHGGQDVFAKCGAKVVAAQGGEVLTSGYGGAYGYYVVIRGKATGKQYVYAHMQRRGRPKQGSVVRTGQQIGLNSDTGNASGCHVHFELRSASGKILNPTRPLRAWDAYS